MTTVAKLFETMDYGPAPESAAPALEAPVGLTRDRGATGTRQLLSDYVGGLAGNPRENEEQMLLEFNESLLAQRNAIDHDVRFRPKLNQVETTESSRDLVLAADVVSENMPFDVNCFAGQFFRAQEFAAKRVQGMQQRNREGR